MQENEVSIASVQKEWGAISALTTESAGLLSSIIELHQLRKGHILLAEGKVCNHIFYVAGGCVKTAVNQDGKTVNLEFALKGEFITNLKSLRESSASELYIQSCASTVVWALNKQSLFSIYKQSPDVELFGKSVLETIVLKQEAHVNSFKLQSPLQRYQHMVSHQPELLQLFSLTDLASYLGISRETITRLRKK